MLAFVKDYCVDAADDFLPKIVNPYFCFYTGSVFLNKVKDSALKKKADSKKELVAEFCSAM